MNVNRAYAALDPTARTMHQLLVLAPGEHVSVEAAAALADLPRAQVQQVLDQLVEHRLLTHTAGRYRQPAQASAHALSARGDAHAPEADAALHRILTWYLHTAHAAATALDPHHWHAEAAPPPRPPRVFTSTHALDWLAEELHALRMTVRLAADLGHHRLSWQLHEAALPYLRLRRSFTLWQQTLSWAQQAARAAADRVGQAVTATSQATLLRDMGHLERAAQEYAHALELWETTARMPGYAHTLIEYGHLDVSADRPGRAWLKFTEALELCQATPDMGLELRARVGRGEAALGRGQAQEALVCFRAAVETPATAPALRLRALTGMATAHLRGADPIAAAQALQRADLLIPLAPGPVASAEVDLVRAELHADTPDLRRTHLVRAYTVLRSVGDPRASPVQAQLQDLRV
ncbi:MULTISPECIES: hypothetical protein [unclassified Nocardiopsis]|uniref:hypothetical protein n=1 Tax=unclassified Nocardiopsis TaxID=2649073 RepID=UPI001357777D|nr:MULTISPECIES: hypothetical protein [unclassified Nocardiopsis]